MLELLFHLVFLQHWRSFDQEHRLNVALWTMSVQVLFWAVFPFVLRVLHRPTRSLHATLSWVCGLWLLYVLGTGICYVSWSTVWGPIDNDVPDPLSLNDYNNIKRFFYYSILKILSNK